jgi:ribosomal protein S12 methylthiotransferase accessory factor
MQIVFPGGKKVSALYHGFTIETDQSRAGGGDGTAPEPFDLFLASIGTCAGVFFLNFCETRNIPVNDAGLIVRSERDSETGLIGRIAIEIRLPSEFPQRYVEAVKRAVQLCTVKKHLDTPPEFEVLTSSRELAVLDA